MCRPTSAGWIDEIRKVGNLINHEVEPAGPTFIDDTESREVPGTPTDVRPSS